MMADSILYISGGVSDKSAGTSEMIDLETGSFIKSKIDSHLPQGLTSSGLIPFDSSGALLLGGANQSDNTTSRRVFMFSGPACQEIKEVNELPAGFASCGLGVVMMGSVFLMGHNSSGKTILRANMTTGHFRLVGIPKLKSFIEEVEFEHAHKSKQCRSNWRSWVPNKSKKRSIDKIFEQKPQNRPMIEDIGSFSDSSED